MVVQVSDRRVFDRFMARFPVKFQYSRNDFGTNVFLRDISAEGARVVTKEKTNLNDKVSLEVQLPDGHEPLILNGRVTWARVINPTTRDVGVKFDEVDFMNMRRIYNLCQ